MIAWIAGAITYLACRGIGGTVPGLLVAMGVYAVLGRRPTSSAA